MNLIVILNIFGICLALFNCADDNLFELKLKMLRPPFLDKEKVAGLTEQMQKNSAGEKER